MLNRFCKSPLFEVTRTLANVAMGVEKAELVIRNAKLVNVCTAEIQDGVDVAVSEGRIALVGDAAHCIGETTRVIDVSVKNSADMKGLPDALVLMGQQIDNL